MSTVPYFEKLLAEHGDSPRSLDWSAKAQEKRFEVLADFCKEGSVLDVGCGLGHLYDFFCGRGWFIGGSYLGVDASDKMIDEANKQAGMAQYCVFDAFNAQPLPEADYVVSSGLLNVVDSDAKDSHYVMMTALLQKCYATARVGCAVNMLSSHAPEQRRDRYYYSPNDMLAVAFAITPKVVLRHDYLPHDFTLILRR